MEWDEQGGHPADIRTFPADPEPVVQPGQHWWVRAKGDVGDPLDAVEVMEVTAKTVLLFDLYPPEGTAQGSYRYAREDVFFVEQFGGRQAC